MKKKNTKQAKRHIPQRPVSLAPNPWDEGANGQANRHGLIREGATDIDPITGRSQPNPNGIERHRRLTTAEHGMAAGVLDSHHVVFARELRAMAEGGLVGGGDPLAAISIKAPAGTPSEPLAAKFDRRRSFMAAWARIPHECRHAVESAVLDDKRETDAFGVKLCDILDGYAKIRVGLTAAFGEVE